MESQNSKTKVSLARCADYELRALREAVKDLLEPLGGMGAFVDPGDRVLLKPNLVVGRPPERAVSTHPEILRAVALEVMEQDGKPFIADSPAFGSARSVSRTSGIAQVARDLNIEIADLAQRAVPRRLGDDSPFPWIRFGAAALEAELIINLPKVKAHCQTGMSLAVKNMYGVVSGKRKAIFHFKAGDDVLKFSKFICAVSRYLNPGLTIADGIVCLERDGPSKGDPRPLGLLAAGADPVAVDRILLEILAVPPEKIPIMEAARALGYGRQELERIEVLGESLEALRVADFVQVQTLSPISFSLLRIFKSCIRQFLILIRGKK